MKKILLIVVIAAGFNLMQGAILQAKDITESRDLSAFNKIAVEGAEASLKVTVGGDFSVTLSGEDDWMGKIFTRVEEGTLIISRKNKNKNIHFTSDNKIIITMPKFTGLEINGAVDAHISHIDSDKLSFEVNGAGNINVSGKCAKLNVTLNGAANFEGEKLICEDVNAVINGVGNIETYGSKTADLTINGMGNIDLYGNPEKVTKDKSLFSNITIHK